MNPRIPLGRAHVLASSIARELRLRVRDLHSLTPVGGLRRFSPEVRTVELFAAVEKAEHEPLLTVFTTLPSARAVIARGDDGATVATDGGRVTLHLAEPAAAGAALVWCTGSIDHVRAVQQLAEQRGLRLTGGRLADSSGSAVPCESEDRLYELLGLPLIPPELRQGSDELEAARAGRLPELLDQRHIRGDLHTHSIWSDGRDTIEEMVRSAIGLGYEYLAITDHSQHAWSSRALSVTDVDDQRAEIEGLRRRYPEIRILHGCEVDIMADGTLDFDDSVLAKFDIVLASLHDAAGQSGRELTERYLAAIRSPLVDVITHPLNRTPGIADGYDLDLERLFEAAAATGTAMEVDGAPGHLDMDGAIARRAAAAGVTIVVDSDCHRSQFLRRQMRFGVGTARRGWIEPTHVLNTRPAEDVLAFVARKRADG